MYKKSLDVEVAWPCSCSQFMYVACKQLKFNITANLLKYETLSSMHLAAFNFLSLWRMKRDTVIFIFLLGGSSFFVSSQCGMAKPCFQPLSLNEKTILQPMWIYAGSKTLWCTDRNRMKVLLFESFCTIESLCNRSVSTLELMVYFLELIMYFLALADAGSQSTLGIIKWTAAVGQCRHTPTHVHFISNTCLESFHWCSSVRFYLHSI